jgi:hypothetical protein
MTLPFSAGRAALGWNRERLGGLVTLLVGGAGTSIVSSILTHAGQGDIVLTHVGGPQFLCRFASAPELDQLRLHAAQANWIAMVTLEAVVAAIGVVSSLVIIVSSGRMDRLWRVPVWWLVLGLGVAAVVRDISLILEMRSSHAVHAFLSDLLSSLPDECAAVRKSVPLARLVGEPAGFALGIAMAANATFALPPDAAKLAVRLRRLQHLLYLASVLFVVGIMVSRANFTFVLAHWIVSDDKVTKAIGDVVRAGTVQSGVGYSALLAVFFLPARMVLAQYVDPLVPAAAREDPRAKKKWLAAHELLGSWQKDAQQILALLAPLLSVPAFDALVK